MKESIFATGVKTQATSDSEPAAAAVTLYLVDDTAEQWVGNDNAVIEIVDNTHGHDHYVMKKTAEAEWSAKLPATAQNITFNRLSPDKSEQWNSWSAGGRDRNNTYLAQGHEYGVWDIIEEEPEETDANEKDIALK